MMGGSPNVALAQELATPQDGFSMRVVPGAQFDKLQLPKISLPEGNTPDSTTPPTGAIMSPTAPAAGITPYADPRSFQNSPLANQNELLLEAQLTADSPVLSQGLVWRVFSPEPNAEDKLPLIATATGGTASFSLPEGSYLVHVSFGRAGATKRVTIRNASRHEKLILDAGGLKLSAKLPDGHEISDKFLRFSIYENEDEGSERSLIVPNIKPDTIVRLNSGTYHVVSNYGNANAVIRAEIVVNAGKLTEATVEHNGAEITMKLLRDVGGEALADTSWNIVNTNGDIVYESVSAYASLVLAAGDYIAVAKNKDRLYQREFTVESGKNEDIDVFAKAENEVDSDQVD
ncbi:hypothetical protein P8H26_15135 [Pseudochrobactrum sp. sp1633]|uniref:hypothetical protein n=1 Tax=Pseudochrobactrum sp. sp1633 TaxID=3036706 RepID=UPI0025A633A1|nr:hypothetical protein [Pseudochrobactrum sp. sp1633]MDM8346724.1 hypothetical protein [Pseudochrobactrum sp. sp1633]HWD13364.1 hypothetical protein [Pseudochrobactrum sp.]